MIDTLDTEPVDRLDTDKAWWKRQISVHAYIFETLFLVALMVVVNLGIWSAAPGFIGIEPNPYGLIILLMLGRYGFKAGLLSSVLVSATYFVLVSERAESLRDLLSWRFAKDPVLFIVVAVLLGMLVQRFIDKIKDLEASSLELRLENKRLRVGEDKLRDVNVELANRVVNATETLPTLYKYAQKLNSLELNELYSALTEMVKDVLKADIVSVYVYDPVSRMLRLHSRNGERDSRGELILDPQIFDIVFKRREAVSLHDLLQHNIRRTDLFMCGPLGPPNQEVQAVLAVEALEFLRYNPSAIRLFNVVIDWAADSLGQAATLGKRPVELRREQNRRQVMRAQGAMAASPSSARSAPLRRDGLKMTHSKELIQPEQAAANAMAGQAGLEGIASTSGSLPAAAGGLRARVTGTGATGALSTLLSQAEEDLFGDQQGAERPLSPQPSWAAAESPPTGAAGEDALSVAGDGSGGPLDSIVLRTMLHNELEIAGDSQGALSRLLGEIDDFLTTKRGGR